MRENPLGCYGLLDIKYSRCYVEYPLFPIPRFFSSSSKFCFATILNRLTSQVFVSTCLSTNMAHLVSHENKHERAFKQYNS